MTEELFTSGPLHYQGAWIVVDLLEVLAVVPLVSLMFAGQKVWPVVPLTLHECEEVVGAVVPLIHRQLGQIHLLLGGHHLWWRERATTTLMNLGSQTCWFGIKTEVRLFFPL